MSFYLGIDGGGTKTTGVIGDTDHILATATAGPSNVIRVGEAQAAQALASVIRDLCSSAGSSPAQISRTCIGLAGAAHPEVRAWVQRAVNESVRGEVSIVGDMEIAMESAFAGGPGTIVIAGTGSIAYARDAQGTTHRVGGWGFAISDEGSGHWIGCEAVRAALRAEDVELGSSQVIPALLAAWNLSDRADLIRRGNAVPPPEFSVLFPIVVQTADAGDAVARDVLCRAGHELAQIAAIAVRKLPPTVPTRVAVSGGVFRHSSIVRDVFYNELRLICPSAEFIPDVCDPVHGALWLARNAK
ncbi:MAG TPA: BadF/BadG/BcrA/BcrD ATPase family protein [Terriglobales bacterium]|jgi:N-acetylglucosamine kinase-like BadF-type ATPase